MRKVTIIGHFWRGEEKLTVSNEYTKREEKFEEKQRLMKMSMTDRWSDNSLITYVEEK